MQNIENNGGAIGKMSYEIDEIRKNNETAQKAFESSVFCDENGKVTNEPAKVEYDENGNIIRSKFYTGENGELKGSLTFTYDENGNISRKFEDTNNDGKTDYMVAFDDQGNASHARYYEYDDACATKVMSDQNNDGKIDFVDYRLLDENGNISGIFRDLDLDGKEDCAVIFDEQGEISEEIYYEYDDANKTEKISSDQNNDGKIDFVAFKQFDESKRVISNSFDFDNDGKYDEKLYFQYNEKNVMTKSYNDEDNDGKIDSITRFELDENGRQKFDENGDPIEKTISIKDFFAKVKQMIKKSPKNWA